MGATVTGAAVVGPAVVGAALVGAAVVGAAVVTGMTVKKVHLVDDLCLRVTSRTVWASVAGNSR